jgi:hypothetical protein
MQIQMLRRHQGTATSSMAWNAAAAATELQQQQEQQQQQQ